MNLIDHREPTGFWVPNAFVDEALPVVKGRGAAVYLQLARALTPRKYPSVQELAAVAGITPAYAVRMLDLLFSVKALNLFDLSNIQGHPAAEQSVSLVGG